MIRVNRHILANGLTVVHNEDKNTNMAALSLLYKAGARDEPPCRTGLAHLTEHLMFGGSANIPDYDTPMQTAGGENNAWTNNDITNYYLTLPANNIETGFWLESDRMLSPDFSQRSLDIQKQVVIEEFKQRSLNQPYGDVPHLLRSMAYKAHPYQWPAIGKETSHIAGITLDDVKKFFLTYYAPGNAVLAVSGNIPFEYTVRLAEKWFGPVPARNVPARRLPKEPCQREERRLEVTRPVPADALYVCFHMCGRTHPDYYAFDMLSDILANGKSSRLIQRLVIGRQICSSADASITGSLDEGLLVITARHSQGHTLEKTERAIWDELDALRIDGISNHELEKVKNRYESEHIFNNIHYLNVATNMACFEMSGHAEDLNDEVRKYRSVDSGQIRRVAQECFRPSNCCTLLYKAGKQ